MLAGLDPQWMSLDFAKRFGTISCAKALRTRLRKTDAVLAATANTEEFVFLDVNVNKRQNNWYFYAPLI